MNPARHKPRDNWRIHIGTAFSSLKVRITLATLVALILGIGMTTAALLQRAERDTLTVQDDRELNEAARTASALSRRVVDLQRTLQAVAPLLDEATLADDAKLAPFIRAQPVLRSMFATLIVASRDGQVKLFADDAGIHRPKVDLADRSYFLRSIHEQRPMVSDPLPSRISGQPVIMFTYPLTQSKGAYGIVAGALRLASTDLLSDVVDAQAGNSDVILVVTDSKGRILAHPNHGRLLQNLATEPRLAGAYQEWVARGSIAEPSGVPLAQSAQLVSVASVAGTDWMVWRATPQASLLAPLRDARRQALGWAVGLTGLMSALMLVLSWWLLRPLTRLEYHAQHLFDGGNAQHDDWPTGAGEIGRLASVLRHIGAERTQLEEINAEVLGKLGSVMAAAPVGIAFSRAQRFELVSAEFCRLFARAEEDLLGQSIEVIFCSKADYFAFGAQAEEGCQSGQAYIGEWKMLRSDGTTFWARLRGRPVDIEDIKAGSIWTLNDIDQQVAERAQLQWSASHDPLTGLTNRMGFEKRLTRVFDALPRSMPAAVVAIDLDHFKPINDTAGHAAGDAMLRAVAAAIASHVRNSDLVGRLGGDEFALLLERCPADVAMRIATDVLSAITAVRLPWEERILSVGASMGISSLSADTASITAWMADADAACYRAKADGRGTVRAAVPLLVRPARKFGVDAPLEAAGTAVSKQKPASS